jgi:hypothetical protein
VAAAKAAGAEYVVVVQYSEIGDPIDMSAPEGYGNASKPAADIPAVMVCGMLSLFALSMHYFFSSVGTTTRTMCLCTLLGFNANRSSLSWIRNFMRV